jgi:hypothetical protein
LIWIPESFTTSHIVISTCPVAVALGVALDVTGRRLVQLFHHANTRGFLLLPSESGKGDTNHLLSMLRAVSAALEIGKRNTMEGEKQILMGAESFRSNKWK